jgi:uncharacterized protein (DUF736 family)
VNQITDPPNSSYDFGLNFNYAAWPKGTQVTLVNVPWNNDYRDIVKFKDRAALNSYIDSIQNAGITIDQLSYAKANQPVRINIPFNRAYQYNYLRVTNPIQPVPGSDELKSFYYFITDIQYIAPNTTEIIVQLDIWQTFGFDVKFGNCYVERGHIGIANKNAFKNYGRDYLTVPEGMDVGAEYQIKKVAKDNFMRFQVNDPSVGCDVLMVSTTDITASPGTVDLPNLVSADGGYFERIPTGATMWVFKSVADFSNFMTSMQNYPWVTQGIISVTMIPKLSRYNPGFVYAPAPLPTRVDQYAPAYKRNTMAVDWRTTIMKDAGISTRYSRLLKLLTFPYLVIEMTTWSATPLVLKPESWNDKDATVVEASTLTPPNQRIVFKPELYNSVRSRDFGVGFDDEGDHLDLTTLISDFPTVPVVNNGQLLYLASNAHGIAYQQQSADWSQQRALQANSVSYDQASAGMTNVSNQAAIGQTENVNATAISNNAASAQAGINLGSSIASGALGGAGGSGAVGGMAGLKGAGAAAGAIGASGIAVGAAAGGLSGAFGMMGMTVANAARDQQTAIQNLAIGQRAAATNNTSGYIRDTNKGLADWAARGDYANAIAAINARVQDARLIPPTTSGQAGGQAFNVVNGSVEISLRWKTVDNATIQRVGDYWLRYGYAIQRFISMPESLMVMERFTYWKLSETYIKAAGMPETYKQGIRGIFEKGVTVWSSPDFIGAIDIADNAPLDNVAY